MNGNPAAMAPYRLLIGGEFVTPAGDTWLKSVDPATEEVIGEIPAGNAQDVERAVAAAERAQPAWAALPASERAAMLRALADTIAARRDEIAAIEARDAGNLLAVCGGDVHLSVEALHYFANLASELKGETIPANPNVIHMTFREPYGVVGRIFPFNHPFMFAAFSLAGPLAAGNAVVLKPPETCSFSTRILAEACCDVLPPGLVNIVTGDGPGAGDALVRHPRVKRLAFTGSERSGRMIQRAAAEAAVKVVTLELGGKNPLIVCPDADPDEVANAAIAGMNFVWQGQSCGSTSRLLLHESLYRPVLDRLAAKMAAIRLANPLDGSAQMGPLNSKTHYDRVMGYVEAGKQEGATLLTGGRRPPGGEFTRGYWLEPTLFADVRPDMKIAQEEIFGPVLSALRWRDEDEAVAIANGTIYGLTASIWTDDLGAALRMARAVRSGYVWINAVSAHYRGTPFGGMKSSGLGREESFDELLSYTETKSVHIPMRPARR